LLHFAVESLFHFLLHLSKKMGTDNSQPPPGKPLGSSPDGVTFPLHQNTRYDRFVTTTPYGNLLADTGSAGTIIRDALLYEECVKRGNPQGSRVYGIKNSTNTVEYCIDKRATQHGFEGVAYTNHIPSSILRDDAIVGIMGLAPGNPSCKNKNDASLTAIVTDSNCVLIDPLRQKLHIVNNGSCEPLAHQYPFSKDVNGSCTNHVVVRKGGQSLVVDTGFPGDEAGMGDGTVLWGFKNMQNKQSMFDFDKQMFSQDR